jgi:8-oxo-(d)GTP phosphatase
VTRRRGDDVDQTVVAAGAVVWRPQPAQGGAIEICLVHRPRYDDWSLPKGKLDADEHLLACAVREVEEETGHRVVLGLPLPTQTYEVNGRPKRVHYWAARADDDAPEWEGTPEVDEVAFLPAVDAMRKLTHTRDTELVRTLASGPIRTTALVVLRHSRAVGRSSWNGPDQERPLDSRGATHAAALTPALAALGVTRVVSSDAVRCVDTVRPFAEERRLTVEFEPVLSEHGHLEQPGQVGHLVRGLLAAGEPTVVCTHRPVLPDVIAAAAEQTYADVPSDPLHAGDFLVLHHRGGVIVAAERFPYRGQFM